MFTDDTYAALKISQIINSETANVFYRTPTLIKQVAELTTKNKSKNSSLKIVISREPLYKSVAQNIRNTFINSQIYHVYGLTEAGPRVSYLPPEEFDKCPAAVGYPLPGTSIKLINEENIEIVEKKCLWTNLYQI